MRPRWYSNPFRHVANLRAERIDQGVDYAGYGPVYPVGGGTIIRYDQHNPGWPGGAFIVVRLSRGRAAGKCVFYAENITLNPRLHVGSKVRRWDSLGTLHDAYPNCEVGWADAAGSRPLAQLYGGYQEGKTTMLGRNMAQLLHATGAPMGGLQPLMGSLPPGWPTWA